MKRKFLMATLIALGLALSGTGHALLIMMPDGTKTEAQVAGNKLMLLDANGKQTPARDGTYKTSAGTAIVVQGGVIASQGVITGPIDNKAKVGTAATTQVPTAPATAFPAAPAGVRPPAAAGAAANVVRIEQLSSKAQFKALPDDTLLEINGKKVRKADFVADFDRRASAKPPAPALGPPTLPAMKARLTADEDAAIAASDVDVRKRMAEIRAQGGKP